MIRHFLTLIICLLGLSVRAITPEDVPNVQVQQADRWVSDPASLLSPQALSAADAALDRLNRENTTEVCAVIVPDLSDIDANDYATRLFELWGIGRKDRSNGLLLLISRDDRQAVIRTGSGMEIAMTDGRAGSVIRHDIAPNMRQGNIDRALLDAIGSISTIVRDPQYYDDLHSDIPAIRGRIRGVSGIGSDETFRNYLIFAAVLTVTILLLILFTLFRTSHLDPADRYSKLDRLRLPALMIVALSLGMGLIPFIILWLVLRHLRLKRHNCPNCGTRMHRVDEVTDNDYLTPAQDMEEKLKSVDYDVWLCPNCNETDIIPYVNRRTSYTRCPVCGSRAESLQANRILRHPTTTTEGLGQRDYRCHNCGNTRSVPYRIAKVASPPIFLGGGGGRGFGGGGGIGGGGFGGGFTSGGGASGSW